jgi:hypothetical protein
LKTKTNPIFVLRIFKKDKVKQFVVPLFWRKSHKKETYFIFGLIQIKRKKFGPVYKELLIFLTKKIVIKLSKIRLGSGFWKKSFQVLDPGVKKAPEPGSGSATLFCME